jgi:hypothetical protein
MSQRSRAKRAYLQAASLTVDVVDGFKDINPTGVAPEFALPSQPMGAGVDQVAKYIVKNEAAALLVASIMGMAIRERLPDTPTLLMLQAGLDIAGIPYRSVPVEELFPDGEFMRLTGPGVAKG